MNTKKILAGVMALSLTAALTACGGGNGAAAGRENYADFLSYGV